MLNKNEGRVQLFHHYTMRVRYRWRKELKIEGRVQLCVSQLVISAQQVSQYVALPWSWSQATSLSSFWWMFTQLLTSIGFLLWSQQWLNIAVCSSGLSWILLGNDRCFTEVINTDNCSQVIFVRLWLLPRALDSCVFSKGVTTVEGSLLAA